MRAVGCDTVVDTKDLSVVGITEILSHLPKIYGLYQRLIAEADRRKPDLAIVIDSPAFNWRVAREMKRRGVPVVYYVAPQFWAWRQGRVRLLRKYVDKALVIFPFEEGFYRERGVDATFVGHPLEELERPTGNRAEYASQFQLDPARPWITLMPGSRVKEVRMNLPTILEAAAKLGSDYEFLLPVAPTLDPSFLQALIDKRTLQTQRITLVPRIPSGAGPFASGDHSQRDGDGGSRYGADPVRDGLPRFFSYLFSGKAAGKGSLLCHGEFDRRQGSRSRAGAARLHGGERGDTIAAGPARRPGAGAHAARNGEREGEAAGIRERRGKYNANSRRESCGDYFIDWQL
jgi:hypothetical protein